MLGNHDIFPIDQTLPIVSAHFYRHLERSWKTTQSSFLEGGYYRVDINEELCFLVVNSIYYDPNNFSGGLTNQKSEQFAWLDRQLQNCRESKKKSWILNHEPPQDGYYSTQLKNIISKYKDDIVHQFYGHRHRDQFLLFSSLSGEFVGSGFLAPSFMPDKHDPAFRIYHSNQTHIHDYDQYTLNLTNVIQKNNFKYTKLYSFSKEYGNEPSTKTFIELYRNIQRNATTRKQFCKRYNMDENNDNCSVQLLF